MMIIPSIIRIILGITSLALSSEDNTNTIRIAEIMAIPDKKIVIVIKS